MYSYDFHYGFYRALVIPMLYSYFKGMSIVIFILGQLHAMIYNMLHCAHIQYIQSTNVYFLLSTLYYNVGVFDHAPTSRG